MTRDPVPVPVLSAAHTAVPPTLDLASLAQAYRTGAATPTSVVRALAARCAAHASNPLWITRVPEELLLERAARLERDPATRALPLYGIPFAVKDNIDVAGLPTTAGCEAFRHEPGVTAECVQRLLDAGAILVGKANLDQFATGLVGTRSPYGEVRNAFDPAYVSGGSSSGSAVAVALGLASFALGTDTAGSGRVPAAFNNIVGLKPTRGLVSTRGVVPACRSLDCVSVFALCADDAQAVLDVLDAFDAGDVFARRDRAPRTQRSGPPRIGIPRAAQLDFFGDHESRALFDAAAARIAALGGVTVEIDLAPFLETADLLYGGPWVAERHAVIRTLLEREPGALLPVIRDVIGEATRYGATDTFEALYRLAALRRATEPVWNVCDAMLVPTAGTVYTRAELAADPIGPNTNLGRYTNFVNLLDLAAIAVPAGFRTDGLPFGVTFVAPAGTDRWLCDLGAQWQRSIDLPVGATGERLRRDAAAPPRAVGAATIAVAPATIDVAVVGAHLAGQPLNHQLTERGAKLVRACRTAATYRLHALAGTKPPKPGLVRGAPGTAIDVEVWSVPAEHFGPFVAGIPAPLGIGTLELEDGTRVLGFLCESYAVLDAEDISSHGGWRAYLDFLGSKGLPQ